MLPGMSINDTSRARPDRVFAGLGDLFDILFGNINRYTANFKRRHELYNKQRSSFVQTPRQKEVDAKLAMLHKLFTLARRLDAFEQDVVSSVSNPTGNSGKACVCVK